MLVKAECRLIRMSSPSCCGRRRRAKKLRSGCPKREVCHIFFSSYETEAGGGDGGKGDDFKTSDVTAKLGAMWRSFVDAKTDSKVKKELAKFEKRLRTPRRYEAEKADYTP